jgi:hypothetical protein
LWGDWCCSELIGCMRLVYGNFSGKGWDKF